MIFLRGAGRARCVRMCQLGTGEQKKSVQAYILLVVLIAGSMRQTIMEVASVIGWLSMDEGDMSHADIGNCRSE